MLFVITYHKIGPRMNLFIHLANEAIKDLTATIRTGKLIFINNIFFNARYIMLYYQFIIIIFSL